MTIERVSKKLVCRSKHFRQIERQLHQDIEEGNKGSVDRAFTFLLHTFRNQLSSGDKRYEQTTYEK